MICEVRPDIIITHWPQDSVPAHANATQMTLLAMDAATCIRPGKPNMPHGVIQVFFHEGLGRANVQENINSRQIATTLIDISDVIDKKNRAKHKFASQYVTDVGSSFPASPGGRQIVGVDHAASNARLPYAESFVAYKPEVHDFLPLSAHSREIAKLSWEEELGRMAR